MIDPANVVRLSARLPDAATAGVESAVPPFRVVDPYFLEVPIGDNCLGLGLVHQGHGRFLLDISGLETLELRHLQADRAVDVAAGIRKALAQSGLKLDHLDDVITTAFPSHWLADQNTPVLDFFRTVLDGAEIGSAGTLSTVLDPTTATASFQWTRAPL